METNVTTNLTLPVSSSENNQNLPYIFLCLLAMTANVLIIWTISMEKSLHNKSQLVLLSLSVGEVLFCLSSCVVGFYKLASSIFNLESYQFFCILRHYPILFSGSLVKNMMLASAIDRSLCMGRPLFYRNVSNSKYVSCLNLICCSHAALVNMFAFTKSSLDLLLPVCSLSIAVDKTYLILSGLQDNLIFLVTIVLYAILACKFWRRYRKEKVSDLIQSNEWRRQMDYDVFLAMVIVGSVYSINGLPSLAMSLGYNSMSAKITNALMTFSLFFILFSSISHLFVYYKVNKLFRSGFVKVVFRRNKVDALQNASSTAAGAIGASSRGKMTLASVG